MMVTKGVGSSFLRSYILLPAERECVCCVSFIAREVEIIAHVRSDRRMKKLSHLFFHLHARHTGTFLIGNRTRAAVTLRTGTAYLYLVLSSRRDASHDLCRLTYFGYAKKVMFFAHVFSSVCPISRWRFCSKLSRFKELVFM